MKPRRNAYSLVSVDVCQLRLDFESLVLMGITDTTETGANAVCQDTLKVTVRVFVTDLLLPDIRTVHSFRPLPAELYPRSAEATMDSTVSLTQVILDSCS